MNKRATETNLNKEEFEQLKEAYITTIVDSMSMKDLVDYVSNDMQDFLDKLSENQVYEEIKSLKDVCGDIHLKTILEIGELKTYENIKKASVIALCAGSDFIKTSTGKISNGSSKEACLVMAKAVYEFKESTGFSAGIKVAGGIRNSKDAIRYLIIIKFIPLRLKYC